MTQYDLAIIGSGPGGYIAGLYASRNKLNVCVIEKDSLGGVCLNKGCIPTKTMLHSTVLLSRMKESGQYGIEVESLKLNFQKIVARKEEVVSRLRAGIETLFRANHIELIKGTAKIRDSNTIVVEGAGSLKAKYIIIATGSKEKEVPQIKFNEADILSSSGILELKSPPKSLVVVGGGAIGCEFACLFNALGTKVTIVELEDRILPMQSREVSKKLELVFKKSGISLLVATKVESVKKEGLLSVKVSDGKTVEAEKVLVSVGRVPNIDGLGLEEIGVKVEGGRVCVNESLRTNIKNIYAIGDCIGGPLLAHKASYDGILACDNILVRPRRVDYSNVPNCIYTDPEIASVGLSEEEAKKVHPDFKVAKFPYLASGKAYLIGRTEGYIKLIGDSKGNLLGVEIFGEGATDLIGEATLAKTLSINIKDLSYVVHGHPTLSEIFQEAAHIFCGTGIHTI